MTQTKQRVHALNEMILKGKIMEAMNEFYDHDVVMGDNNAEPTVGLTANLEREQQFVDHTTWYDCKLLDVVVDGDTSMTRWYLDFHNTQYGDRMAFTQVAVAK